MFSTNIRCFLSQICLCLLLFSPTAYADDAQISFSQGVKEYKQGHYVDALNYFLVAENKGYQSSQLFHNLGVVYLKLDQLDQARKNFLETLRYPSIAALGNYNLGLIALKRGNTELANTHFTKVIRISQDPNLTILAQRQLLKDAATNRPIQSWKVLTKVSRGYDDNVNFSPEDVGSGIRDAYTELLLYGTVMFTKNQPIGLGLDAYVYDVNYDDVDANNYTQNAFLLKFPIQYERWLLQPGLIAQWSRYGGTGYQKTKGFEFSSRYFKTPSSHYLAKYSYEDIESLNNRYNFLEGSRQRLKLENQYSYKAYKTNVYYELENNDRTDRGNASYSPLRNTISGQLTYAINSSFTANGNIKYRISDYERIKTFSRHDKQLQFSWGGEFKFNKHVSLKGIHTWTKNNSSKSFRKYKRHRVALNLQLIY